MGGGIEQQICEAIDIIVKESLKEVKYNKTIQATVIECIDSTIGKYKLKYQDSLFYAYSENLDITYLNNSTVYVMIPNDSDDKDRIILGAVKKLGINYITAIEGEDAYEVNGKNCIEDSSSIFSMCSYKKGRYTNILYHKNYNPNQNKILINETSLNEYIKKSKNIICSMNVRTQLPREQQFKGNYGMIVALDFMDNSLSQEVTRTYTVDVDKMIGNPYKQITETNQYGIFDIDNENFLRVNYISLFCYNFPNSKEDNELVDDIFIKDIKLCGASKISEDDINNYSLTFVTPQGTYFDETADGSIDKIIRAQVRVKGKIIDNSTQPLSYYWFTENVGVTSQNQYYNKYGGQGWKCLNNYNIVKKVDEADQQVVEWIPATYEWTVKKEDIQAKEVRYKCSVVYDKTVISKIITIKNLESNFNITIKSDLGEQFYFDIGRPTLTCLVNGIENSAYTYSWAIVDNSGNFQQLSETVELNQLYQNKLFEYKSLLNDIEQEVLLLGASSIQLENLQNELNKLENEFRVQKNVLYKVKINEVTNYSTYQCSVHYGEKYLGTAQIVLKNSLELRDSYNLIIENGSFTYKYNENGISPTSSTVDNPIQIKELGFKIFDPNGIDITEKINCISIKWKVPIEGSLIRIPDSYKPSEIHLEENYAVYSGEEGKLLKNLAYLIADRYDISKVNNTIELEVVIPGCGHPLIAQTALTFIKEGEPGTNGTEFICKIVPNIIDGRIPPLYPTIVQTSNDSWYLNYDTINLNKFFRAQLWHNENKILDSVTSTNSTEGKSASITWEILKNKYTVNVLDSSALSVNAATGLFDFNGYRSDSPANIVKVTVVYDGITYYATIPIITIKLFNDDYKVTLKEYSGFRYVLYSSDGRSPKYNNSNPFNLTVTKLINGYEEDISLLESDSYKLNYDWNYLGRVYENSQWVNTIYLNDVYGSSNLEKNKLLVKPSDNFDGQCVTNAIECIISHKGNEAARIHIPIHFLLNKYGQSALNSWDGNSIEINDEGGFILSPQVGAGIKENDNSFTGVLIGKVKESNRSDADIGLLGYAQGVRSIFLDAETGKAEFGANGKGKFIIDPTSNRAQLYSGNYSVSNKTGMLIDLTTPEIRFGSGNFSVDKDGHVTAKGGGSIAGWEIGEDQLSKGKVGMSSNNASDESIAFWAGSTNKDNAPFRVNFGGHLLASTADIGSGSNKIHIGKSSKSNIYSAIYSGSKSSFDANATGFYIGTDGIALGYYNGENSAFQVNSQGEMIARTGYIGNSHSGWKITSNRLESNDQSIYIGTGGMKFGDSFSVTSSGRLTATSVDISGKISATSGEIGGWTINRSTLTGGGITLNSNGSMRGPNWSISADGLASFSNIGVTGGSISLGGSLLNASGTSFTEGSTNVGGKNINTYVKDLAVDTLKANKAWIESIVTDELKIDNILEFRDHNVGWVPAMVNITGLSFHYSSSTGEISRARINYTYRRVLGINQSGQAVSAMSSIGVSSY